jgi:phosphoglycolate phosphatase
MIKLVAFDWNGTILDDTKFVWQATNITRKTFGYPPISLRQYKKTFDIPIIDFWLANGGKREDMLTEHDRFHRTYEKLGANARTRGGAKRILTWLRKNKIHTVIYSNHTAPEINRQLKRLGISKFFDQVLARVGVEDQSHMHQRSKEAKLLQYIRRNGFKPSQVLSVGDTVEEIEIGHRLGLKTAGISGGENTVVRLKAVRPDFLIHNLVELEKIIQRLNRK